MHSFLERLEAEPRLCRDPWLILGKGPSFEKRAAFDLSGFRTLALNHAVREQRVDVAHLIDLEVLDGCAEALEHQARLVVLPWIPHVGNRAGDRDLAEWVRVHPVLQRLERRGVLAWYNAATADRHRPGSPLIPVTFFSAEAALNLLAEAGVREVRTLGVDGGRRYGADFSDLERETLLANGQASFDRQFEKFAETLLRTGIDFGPLDVETPVRVYVGTTEAQMLPTRVLEYTLRRHASLSVAVHPLHRTGISIPVPRAPENRPRTPFSFQRFLIPEAAGFRGRALYLDSDMQVFRDVRSLWTSPFEGAEVLGVRSEEGSRAQFAVMLLDCERLRWDVKAVVAALDRGEIAYEALMNEMGLARSVRGGIDPAWNHLDRYEAGRTALLHYTDMPRQPWLSSAHPLGHLWVEALREALAAGFLAEEEVERAVEQGFVRPSLLYQLERGVDDGARIPPRVRRDDARFVPPHRMHASLGSPG